MSNGISRPWYRNPVYLGVICALIAAVIAAIVGATWTFWLNPPPSDFSISVNPMKGEVHQGGVITTAITIKGIQGYEHPVSLSAIGLPSGIVVTFIPPIGGPTPWYTSTVTINVDPSLSAGVYIIIIKGTGADGKEHSCNYILTVGPILATPTPIITPTFPLCGIINFDQEQRSKVTRNTTINFSWNIYKEPPSYLAGLDYYLEIRRRPSGETVYSQTFEIPEESLTFQGNASWEVPHGIELGNYTSILRLPYDPQYVKVYTIHFEIVETLLVIQKLIDNKDKSLNGWKFTVTDPDGNSSTHETDEQGEILISIPEENAGKYYIIEEIPKDNWKSILLKQTVKVQKGDIKTVPFQNIYQLPVTKLLIQKFDDTNRNSRIDSDDKGLQNWGFRVTDPDGDSTTHFTDVNGEKRIEVPKEYEGKNYTIEEILEPNWEPVLPIKQTVKVSKGHTTTVQFLNLPLALEISIAITTPKDGSNVSWRHMVEGVSSATNDSGLSVSVLIWQINASGPWLVQPTTTFSNGSWQSNAYFGREDTDIGLTCRVVAIITTQKLTAGQTFIKLPYSVAVSKEILVTRI